MTDSVIIQRQGMQVEAKPAFSVTPKTKKIAINRASFVVDSKSRRLATKTEEVEVNGYEVSFYRGHSLFVLSLDELRRLGYTGPTPYLADTGSEGEAEVVMTTGSQIKAA